MSSSSSAARNAAPPPPEVTTEPTESDQEIARLRERVKELEARLAPPEALAATHNEPQFSSIVLFGADGNLATKKTFPTLFALWRKKLLPRDIVIIGYAREAMDTETFRKNIVRSRRPAVLRGLHAVDATRGHLTMKWVVSVSILRPFGPRRATAMLRAGLQGHLLLGARPARAAALFTEGALLQRPVRRRESCPRAPRALTL